MTNMRSATAKAVSNLLAHSANSVGDESGGLRPWQAFVDAGFPWAAVSAERGGPDGTVRDAADIIREIGRAAAAVPAGDTDLLGDWLLRQANLPAVHDPLAVAPGNASDDLRLHRSGDDVMLTGSATRVGWTTRSDRFVAVVNDGRANYVVCIPTRHLNISAGESLAGEPRDDVTADSVILTPEQVGAAPELDIVQFRARGAATRTLLIEGAVHAVVELTLAYCSMREQFGRRIRDFQAVGHQLALMRERATLASAAAELASGALEDSGSWEDAAAAKIVAGEIAGEIARAAHQLHGAIGVSEEYPLHRYTRRLWAWRDEYGGEHEWASRLGASLIERGPESLWPWVVSSPDEAI